MGNAVAEPSAVPHKDRKGWLIAFGVIEIMLGICSLLMCALMLTAPFLLKPEHAAGTPAGFATASMVLGAGFYVSIAAFFLVVGIGSIKRRNWARILAMIGSGLWLALGTLAILLVLFLLPKIMAVQHPIPPPAQHVQHIILGVMVLVAILFGILLPLAFLIFYSRKSVKATFLARDGVSVAAGPPARKLPVPVTILVIWEAFGAVSALLSLIWPMHVTFLFGYVIRGWTMIALVLVFSAMSGAAAWLIYKVRMTGWILALLKVLFFGASTGVSLATGGMSRLLVKTGQEQIALLFPQFFTVIMTGTLIVCTAYLVLMIYSLRFFLPAAPSAAS